ncbi:hypothetical protein RB195_016850 [Necator americanus]|uniref:Uncharacterized protein n=1 Tax=Necator americanus TaxID=51031 RepID=A0ABR1C2G6_NECAM
MFCFLTYINLCKAAKFNRKADTSLAHQLLESTHLSQKSTLFKYEAKDVKKHVTKLMDLVHFHWPNERLPEDFNELLQIITLCSRRKVSAYEPTDQTNEDFWIQGSSQTMDKSKTTEKRSRNPKSVI